MLRETLVLQNVGEIQRLDNNVIFCTLKYILTELGKPGREHYQINTNASEHLLLFALWENFRCQILK